MVRGLVALLEEKTDESRGALLEWLPSAADLLRITELEVAWRSNPWSSNHPALLLARLHALYPHKLSVSSFCPRILPKRTPHWYSSRGGLEMRSPATPKGLMGWVTRVVVPLTT